MQVVNRTCKRFNRLINCHLSLWTTFVFDEVHVSSEDLTYILKHSKNARKFLFGRTNYQCSVAEVDLAFAKYLSIANKLYWLNISESITSTLCFLTSLRDIQILDVSGCKNLINEDFAVIGSCRKLEQLYISFTNATAETIINITKHAQLLVLEARAIEFSLEQCRQELEQQSSLLYLHISLLNSVSQEELADIIIRTYIDCHIRIYTS